MYRHLLTDVLYRELGARSGAQVAQEDVLPVGPVGYQAQITERLLRRANFAFDSRQQVTCKEKRILRNTIVKFVLYYQEKTQKISNFQPLYFRNSN